MYVVWGLNASYVLATHAVDPGGDCPYHSEVHVATLENVLKLKCL